MPDKSTNPKRFLLVDDHAVIRSGLNTLLKDNYYQCEIVELSNTADLLELLAKKKFDLIIMDLQLPNTEPLSLLSQIIQSHPHQVTLYYSMSPEELYSFKLLRLGAKGFVSKHAPISELMKAIRTTLEGKRYLSEEAIHLLSEQGFKKPENPLSSLSPRELELVTFFLSGKSVTDIGLLLQLKNSTISTHKARIFKKLQISNLMELRDIFELQRA